MSETIKIAIDGPSGSGKSTLAKGLAKELGYVYVDTGAIYRTVGLFAKRNSIDPHDEDALSARFSNIDISLKWEDGVQKIFLSDEDVSELIRTPEASMYASAVSALPKVRAFLLEMQRSFAKKSNVIMDGRDIGTVILPDAQVKIFMQAHPEERARRRMLELNAKGKNVTFEEVYADMCLRDKNDSTRDVAPCVPADDAVVFDNTGLDIPQTVEKALEIIKEKLS
ncbi:MAG: (d)CMP kinase [Ruminococcaceae bacterium]|nr:(d)CMP kinase [Oscillospiraceae bacterium]